MAALQQEEQRDRVAGERLLHELGPKRLVFDRTPCFEGFDDRNMVLAPTLERVPAHPERAGNLDQVAPVAGGLLDELYVLRCRLNQGPATVGRNEHRHQARPIRRGLLTRTPLVS